MKVIANLSWSLDVECTHCKFEFDITRSGCDEEGLIASYIFNNRWSLLKGHEIECGQCNKAFVLGGVEH